MAGQRGCVWLTVPLAILAFVFCTGPKSPRKPLPLRFLGTVADSSGSVIPNAKVTLLRISYRR